ncbi:hypothetical protein F5Y09DRAFT_288582 [Xylaria sp. FL1042]|nr:hypothetical protein F5Y09DRAFT_288582 [Xylaria sp. FL1042]
MLLPTFGLHERQASHAPCPQGNGTMIGDQQKFVVFCNTRFRGDEVLRQKTDSLATCAGLCTTFQNPRCEGAQFKDNNDCVLIGNLQPDGTRPTRFFDSVAAVFPQPGPTSSCAQQGTGNTFLSQNARFTLQCGKIANGADLEQQFQMTFESCIAACGANPACAGVSYDPSQSAGFQNCYLKSAIDPANVFAKIGVDTAMLVNDADQVAGAGASVVSTVTAPVAVSQSTTYVTVIPDPGTVSIPVTVTPASSTTGALAASTPKASTKAASSGADDDGLGSGVSNNSGRPKFDGGGTAPSASSNAWIAAPVIGGIAALTLLLAIFVLWQRRRRREEGSSRRSGGGGGAMSRAARGLEDTADRIARGRIFGGGSEKTKLRDSESEDDSRYGNSRGGFKVVSGSGRRLGLSEQQQTALGTGPGLGGMIVTTGGGKVVDRLETGAGGGGGGGGGGVRFSSSAGLRDSQNGLRQNRPTGEWLDSRPGIPAEFRGPPQVK